MASWYGRGIVHWSGRLDLKCRLDIIPPKLALGMEVAGGIAIRKGLVEHVLIWKGRGHSVNCPQIQKGRWPIDCRASRKRRSTGCPPLDAGNLCCAVRSA